jgi:hypothetical protein
MFSFTNGNMTDEPKMERENAFFGTAGGNQGKKY